MLKSGESLKDFYRIAALNPHIELHDACQILVARPDASVCFSFEEWNAMGRRIHRGSQGIKYYDIEGNKKYVFTEIDTHGDRGYLELKPTIQRMLDGLDLLNGNEIAQGITDEYRRVYMGVAAYLIDNDYLSEDEQKNRFLCEGVTYSLYSKTEHRENESIRLHGLPYALKESATVFKEIYALSNSLTQKIEKAYIQAQQTEIAEEKEPEPKVTVTPYYQRYLDEQEKYPNDIVLIRLGDFYEAMDNSAIKLSSLLDLTLTGRNVGLPERVPMCGFPYHSFGVYTQKIAESHNVVVIENNDEVRIIRSKKEIAEEKESNKEAEQDFEDDFSDEENEDEQESDYSFDDNEQDFEEEFDEPKKPKKVKQPQEKETEKKSIRERKGKKNLQPSLFDLIDETKEKTPEEKLIEYQLKRGSGFAHGKFRIYEQYFTDPTVKEYADFLKREYGIGGYHSGGDEQWHDGKGITMELRDKEHPENDIVVKLNWTQVANEIADLIDQNNYLTENERQEYEHYIAEKKGKPSVVETVSSEDLQPQEKERERPAAVNTDLSELELDSNELGGAKARFKSNVEAILLVDKLYKQDRTPTLEEKKTLAKYVGWGGLQQAFDEHNESWQKEYSELKSLLFTEDYDRARGSTLNAHFTSKEVIEGIYQALNRFGVKGNNRILEPAMGTGNFYGYMPKDIAENAKMYGVELDNITGKIAKKLYPDVNVQIKGFEETSFPNNHFDVVVSNVPFGAYSVYDSEYNKYNFHIHDYFIAKGIDKLKPNGIMAVITSKGTMDKLNPTVRKHIADRAEFLGAIRLPNTAFKQTAGTEVTADILFFQKRGELINSSDLWIYTNNNYPVSVSVDGLPDGYLKKAVTINSYFADHPEMMLGTLTEERGLYGAIDITLNPDGRNLSDALTEAILHLPENIYKNPDYSAEAAEQEELEVDYDLKPLCFKAVDGKLYTRVGSGMIEQDIPKIPQNAYERISEMISLRQDLRHILDIQSKGCSDEALNEAQRKLNQKYDRFVRLYGFVNSQTNTRLFRDDGDSALLFAAENLSEDKKTATKADIFSKRTIRPYSVITHTDDCFEALQISKNEKGKVDIAYIEELTKKDYDTVLSELDKAIFRNPLTVIDEDKYSGFETSEEYLSGRVVTKLKTASQFVRLEKMLEFERNVKALEEVQPEFIKASEISARLGASYINKEYYHQFLCELLKIQRQYKDGLELFYNPHDSSWRVDKTDYVKWQTSMNANQVYGTERASAFRLYEDCLNLKATQIYDTVEEDGKTKRVLNHGETVAAREKQNKIKEAFKEWIFNDPERREDLETTYNGLFNQIRLPDYDGTYLKFPQMNPAIELKDHQKNAVHRTITSGNTLLHHVVGAGKTYTVCATAMKLRQYGLAKKPMITVPNHLVQQWASEFRTLYPTANLLIANKEDLEKENRQKFISKVAMGDWDAVIIAQSSFAKIPISPERQATKIREEINLIEETIDNLYDEGSMPRGAVKNLERIKKNKETFLKKLMDGDKKDNLLTFESLGVDYLFVDEAHNYKNLFLYTKMNNVAGISTAASQRASDLQLKCEYINDLHNGDKGVVFATGTPISNSMTEMFTMQTYLQKRTLQQSGITYFDGWAADFGETVTSLEMAPSGQGYKAKTRFAKFTNLPELLTLYRSFADVKTADMVKLNVPEAERIVVTLKPSDTVLELAEAIAERAERISTGSVDPSIDNMLKITSDGKKLALDARCFDRFAADEPTSKLNECAKRVFEIWENSAEIKGTQLVFCDLSTPKKAFEDYEYGKDFDVYNDLKYKLVQKGIPEDEIAFIHDANSDLQKQALFNNVNDGKVRVLIGSTEKCGSGTNVQKRLIALHHLDTPYRPSDLQQREGRIVRQGNTNEKVQIYTYVTERTFDSYSYQILENKQRFISQIDRGDLTVREADDIDATTLTYAEIKAITAANPMIKRKMEIDTEVTRLRILEGQFKKSLYGLQDKIRRDLPEQIRKQTLYLERIGEDIEKVKQNYNPEVFSINVLGVTYTDKKDGGKALMDAFTANKTDVVVAEYAGFKLSLNPLVLLTEERSITIAGSGQYSIDIGVSASGNLTRLDNFLEDLPQRSDRVKRKLLQLEQDLEIAKEQVKKPFEHTDRLTELLTEQAQINAALDLNKREEVVIDDSASDGDGESEASEQYMGLPEVKTVQKTRRKPMTKELHKVYKDITAKSPEGAYLFMQNGSRYELIGEQAKELAESYGLPLTTQEINQEKISVVSLEVAEMDKIIGKLVGKGSQIKVIEPFIQKQEEIIISNEEKEITLLPDYTVSEERKQEYGYLWDGMLLLNRRSTEKLHSLGLQIYRLNQDNTESAVETKGEIDEHNGFFGVEKETWNKFLETDKAVEYLTARRYVSDAASKVANDDLSYVDERFTIGFIETNYDERYALKDFLSDKAAPDDENIKGYLPDLISEFTARISGSYLGYYGWDSDDVRRAIIGHIDSPALRIYAGLDVEKDGLMIKSQVDGWDDWSTKTLPDNAREAAEWLILNGYENESDVRAAFYDRQTSSMSDDRFAEENDNAAIVRVAEKYRQNTTENETPYSEKETTITVLIRRAGQEPTIETIENTLEAKQKIVDGYIEMPYNPEFSEGLQVVCNEEGKFLNDPISNVYWGDSDVLFGDILFVGIGDEGETISLTQQQIDEAKKWLTENDASEFMGEAIDLATAKVIFESGNIKACRRIADEYWGEVEQEETLMDGIYRFDTAGHGGYVVDGNAFNLNKIPDKFFADDNRQFAVFEEDCDWAALFYFYPEVSEEYYRQAKYTHSPKFYEKYPTHDSFYQDCVVETMKEYHKEVLPEEATRNKENQNTKPEEETRLAETKQYIPIYKESAIYARENNEIDQFRASMEENRNCRQAIEQAIHANYDDNTLKKGFETDLIEKFGMERMAYVLANTLQEKEWDGRFSKANKEWAKTISVYDDKDRRGSFVVDTHSVLTDAFTNRIREAMKQPQEKKEENAVETAEEKTAETAKEKINWLRLNVAKEALIRQYDDTSFMRMPPNSEYADYTYNLFNSRIKESTQIYDLQSDSREQCLQVLLKETDNVRLTNKKKETVMLTAREYYELVGGTTSKDYQSKQSDDKQWFSINVPEEAMIGSYEDSSLFQMPNKPEIAGFSFYIPNSLISKDEESESGRLIIRLPEDFEITAKNKAKNENLKLTAYALYDYCNDTDVNEFTVRKSTESVSGGNGWNYFSMNNAAKITDYEERTLFKMPKGEYENFFYYIPNKLIKENEETGALQFNLPDDFIVKLSDNKNGEKVELSVEQFLKEVRDKTDADYTTNFHKPSDSKANAFAENEKVFADKIPDEMKNRPNWIIIRTKENAEKGRLDKFVIDCHTGKGAEIDNPATWTDFKTASEYAKANGGETLAYALDGKDKICCIDLDKCVDENGNYSALAKDFINKSKGTYTERSISGKGLHIFGKTDGLDIRAFSKDGDLEFYQSGRFIAMTGDMVNDTKNLINLDKTDIKPVLEEKCVKRTEWKGMGQGIDGLSSMTDRDVVEKAISSKGGDTFKALYNGQNLQNNHSNSDMSLMNRLAFWCNGDKEQMLRVFATSGLYRPEKSAGYYECTVIKAIRDTTSRFQPQTSSVKPIENKKPDSSGGNGKA